MTRFALALAVLLAATGNAFAQSVDAPPTRPGNFRATLYDKAGGELFWQRSTDDRGAVRGYEITRNGESLGIRDALSYYDPTLQPGVPYTFTVVAIDNAGQRSSVATTTLGGGTAPPSTGGAPAAPAALRSDVYSRIAAELFWRREPAVLALRYEIRRDGEVVGTTNGVSYYTNALRGGTDYAFEVIAIDRDGQRSSPSRITVRTTGDSPSTPPVASGPEAPDELRADVYSRRSAELFWKREPAALRLRYEIRRDGQVVGTTDGVSFYTRDLAAGTDYVFEVIAIGRDGGRSAPATIAVRTDGGSTPTPSALAAPANLRAEVYSRTAAELFWDRAATPGLRYEVTRDGEVVGTTNGTSFFDDALSGGTSYRYEVVAIDSDGRRSTASAVQIDTGRPDAPVTDEPALDEIFVELIVSLGAYETDTAVARVIALADIATSTALASRPVAGTEILDPLFFREAVTTVVEYDCALGGSFVSEAFATEESSGGSGGSSDISGFRFEACRLAGVEGETVVEGELVVTSDFRFGSRADDSRREHAWSDFSVSEPGGNGFEIDGETVYAASNDSDINERSRTIALSRYVEAANGATVRRLDDVSFELSKDDRGNSLFSTYRLDLSGSVTSAATGGVLVSVETLDPLVRERRNDGFEAIAFPFQGQLLFRSAGGDSLTVTARNTDTDALFVDLSYVGADGTRRESENVPFADLEAPSPGEVAAAIEEVR